MPLQVESSSPPGPLLRDYILWCQIPSIVCFSGPAGLGYGQLERDFALSTGQLLQAKSRWDTLVLWGFTFIPFTPFYVNFD